MPRRRVGFVELEWQCPTCQKRNPGTERLCQGCGAAQPENVQFEAPVEQKLVTEPAQIEQASQQPNVHCPFCDTRNRADAKRCSQCGAELAGATSRSVGRQVGGFDESVKPAIICPSCGSKNPAAARSCLNCGAALDKPRPIATMPNKQARGWAFGLVFILFGLAMLVTFGLLIYQATRQETITGTVQSAQWVRTIEIEALVPVRANDWQDQLPADAEIESCRLEQHGQSSTPTENSQEVCGTPYTVDQGTGFGEVVQDCWYEVYESMCTYSVQRWQTVDQATTSGFGYQPFWPELNLSFNQRVGRRKEELRCVIGGDGQTYEYAPTSLEEFTLCEVGKRWQMQVNGFGSIQSIQPLQ